MVKGVTIPFTAVMATIRFLVMRGTITLTAITEKMLFPVAKVMTAFTVVMITISYRVMRVTIMSTAMRVTILLAVVKVMTECTEGRAMTP